MQFIEMYLWPLGHTRQLQAVSAEHIRSLHIGDGNIVLYASIDARGDDGHLRWVYDASREMVSDQYEFRLLVLPHLLSCITEALARGVKRIGREHIHQLVNDYLEKHPAFSHSVETAVSHVFGSAAPGMLEVLPGTWLSWAELGEVSIESMSSRGDPTSRTHYVRIAARGRQSSRAWALSRMAGDGLTFDQAVQYQQWIFARWGQNTPNQLWRNSLETFRTPRSDGVAPDPSLRRLDLGTEPDVAPTAERSVAEHGETDDDRVRREMDEVVSRDDGYGIDPRFAP